MDRTISQPSSWFGRWRLRLSLESYYQKATVMTYIITFVFLFAVTSEDVQITPGLYYFLLLMAMLSIGYWYEMDHRDEKDYVPVFPKNHFKIKAIPYQVAGGFMLAMGYLALVLIAGTMGTGARGTDEVISMLMFNILIVGMVEGIMILVYVRVVFLGVLVFPFIFAFLHPMVGLNWTAGDFNIQSIQFFVYAVPMAFMFIAILMLRDTLQPKTKSGEPIDVPGVQSYKFFGFVAQAIFHGLVNVFNVVLLISLGGVFLS